MVKEVEGGQYLGYSMGGYSEIPIRVATVNAGYADGFRRGLGNVGRVLIHGTSCPIIGRVCMDQMIVNISAVPDEVMVGDEVVLLGKQGGEEIEVCEHSGLVQTGGPEITCLFTRRVQRIYIRDGKPAYRVDYERIESPIE